MVLIHHSAGKTALLSQFAYKHFKENYKATIGSGAHFASSSSSFSSLPHQAARFLPH